jgi:hypothetical protein
MLLRLGENLAPIPVPACHGHASRQEWLVGWFTFFPVLSVPGSRSCLSFLWHGLAVIIIPAYKEFLDISEDLYHRKRGEYCQKVPEWLVRPI